MSGCADWPVAYRSPSVVTDTINTFINSGPSGSTEEDKASFKESHGRISVKAESHCDTLVIV